MAANSSTASPLRRATILAVLALATFALRGHPAAASDHLDTPTVIADPSADIGDLFAWTSADGRHLDLAMTVVGHRFSDQLQYVFHVARGAHLGTTDNGTDVVCTFDGAGIAECWAGDADHVRGDAGQPAGLVGEKGRFRVFAGPRDDPFFNNVKGTRAALGVAEKAIAAGAKHDASGCPTFDATVWRAILDQWRTTEGGAAQNFLAGWWSSAIVVEIDLDAVRGSGALMAVWASVHTAHGQAPLGPQIERVGRPLIGNGLLGPLAPREWSDARKEEYNRAAPAAWAAFAPDIERTLALYDGFDGTCGNAWLADAAAPAAARYRKLAELLADDRLWVDTAQTHCAGLLAVELGALGPAWAATPDCGGRTPTADVDVLRSLLATGYPVGITDGVDRDDRETSITTFPFLAPPAASSGQR